MLTPIIGLEIHLQLKTKSKVFCKCSTGEAEPNTNICPICLGYPGAMPNLNKEAVLQAIRMGLALNCKIANQTSWDRKSYSYPDLFKGYQISQLDEPICGEGEIEVLIRDRRNYYSKENYFKKIGIIRAHLEEDTAKSIHEENFTLLDGNKAGIPLLEVVSMPEMHSVDEAVSYAKTIRNIARWFSICDGNLELGEMRFDANISICVEEFDISKVRFNSWKNVKHTPIVEIKNLNSFGNLQDALDYEINRQITEYEKTKEIYSHGSKETRGWNDTKRETFTQRKKEEANEYRFIPEPDIPVLLISNDEISKIKTEIGITPSEVKANLSKIPEISTQAIDSLIEERNLYDLYKFLANENELISAKIANLITNELSSEILNFSIKEDWKNGLREVIIALKESKITSNELKEILKNHKQNENDWEILLSQAFSTEKVDPEEILKVAIAKNPQIVEQIKSGKDSAKMFFVGIVMKETKGKANANEIKDLIDKLIG